MAASAVVQAPAREKTPTPPIDREKTCPFLLRVFCNTGRPYPLSEFSRGNAPPNELQIYTWHDCTLRELATLIKEVNTDARPPGTIIEFNVVYPNMPAGRFSSRDIGTICVARKGQDDKVTLRERRFMIGDYLNVAIHPSAPMRPMRMGMRY